MTPANASRRLAAILAADVVGFTRMTAIDEEGTIGRLSDLRSSTIDPSIASYNGRVFKSTGDGLLAEFPSVVEALRCAVEIQRQIGLSNEALPDKSKLVFRIGVNLGDVMVQGDDILGDGVNIAARLEGLAKPGGICIAGKVFDEVQGKFDTGFSYRGEQKLKNIETPMPVYDVEFDAGHAGSAPPNQPHQRKIGGRRLATALAAAVVFLVAGAIFWIAQQKDSVAHGQSIAVLPFQNFSGTDQQAYFADGIAEDIITDLSKISSLFVIARNTSFQYRGRSVDVAQVGRSLGVQYILEGSVRREQDSVRINAKLIEVASGGNVWAERFDGSITDVFAVQDEVTTEIINALKLHLTDGEKVEVDLRGTSNPEAYDSYLRGRKLLSERKLIDVDRFGAAKKHFGDAVALDPEYALAMAGLAWTNWLFAQNSTVGLGETSFRIAEKSIELQDNALARRLLSRKHFALHAWYHTVTKRMDLAVAELQRARQLQPNDPDVLADLALAMSFNGEPEAAVKIAEQAQALNPNHPKWYFASSGIALLLSDHPVRAANHLQTWSDDNPSWYLPLLFLAAAQGNAGETETARATLARSYKMRHYEIMLPAVRSGWPMKPDQEAVLMRGLRAAGARESFTQED